MRPFSLFLESLLHSRFHLQRRPPAIPILLALAAGLAVVASLFLLRQKAPQSPPHLPAIGIEAAETLILDRPDYTAVRPTPSAPLNVRIVSVEPLSKDPPSYQYKVLFTGFDNGTFNLTDFLLNPLGGRLREPIATVSIHSNIPANAPFPIPHPLPADAPKPLPYTLLLWLATLAWAAAGIQLFRPKKTSKAAPNHTDHEEPIPQKQPPQSLAAMLHPLVSKAADKSITSREKAHLEQILFLYWGKQLELDHLDSNEQLRRILEHPEAGALLRTVEQWLYQPDSLITAEEISAALSGYESLSAEELPPPRPLPPPTPPVADLTDAPANHSA